MYTEMDAAATIFSIKRSTTVSSSYLMQHIDVFERALQWELYHGHYPDIMYKNIFVKSLRTLYQCISVRWGNYTAVLSEFLQEMMNSYSQYLSRLSTSYGVNPFLHAQGAFVTPTTCYSIKTC